MSKLQLIMQVSPDRKRLLPVDPWSAEKLDGMKPGKDYTATITEKRSLSQNNLYWAGLAYAVENIEAIGDRWPTSKSLHKALLIHLGYYTEVPFIQLRDEEITDAMVIEGTMLLHRFIPVLKSYGETADKLARFVGEIYQAMRRRGPHYGVHIVEDSTRFDEMGGEDFTLYFDRVKIVIMQWCDRDPFEEWIAEKREADLKRASARWQ